MNTHYVELLHKIYFTTVRDMAEGTISYQDAEVRLKELKQEFEEAGVPWPTRMETD